MDLEKLFEDAVDEDDSEKLEKFLELLMDCWVFFFLLEKEGQDTPISSENVEQIIFTGKDNPINIPTISDESGNNGVIYTNSDLAERSAEFKCKVGRMRGIKALEMFLDIPSIDAVYIQCDTCNVHIPKNEIRRIIESYA
ncbi:MAG: hypothetical protein HRU20_04570 [Pseudomonadales bacterium]|nr:hypothetical protein [Pseudomonadales bacterium]